MTAPSTTRVPAPAADALYLVDGYALIYRAFFAMISRPLTTSRGENSSAAWGVVNFLLRLQERYHPAYLGWVLDLGESFRHRTYAAYKATRQKLGEELQQDFARSLERIGHLLEAFRVPVLALDGYEADDVIATLATQAAARGTQTVIVSGDKDFYQLIGRHIVLLNPGRGGPAGVEEHFVDESNARERLGVPPERVTDYLALVGDVSDNVPGVRGVGEKTALELLTAYGDLETILARAAEIPGKRPREALLAHGDQARLSRELVTVRRDVPIALDLEALRVQAPDAGRLTELFTALEFRSLLPRLPGLATTGAPTAPAAPAVEPVAQPAAVVDDVAALAPV
ncbi:MAG: 5'-3' exonuclease, partial [Gemmatimonadales bacterium]